MCCGSTLSGHGRGLLTRVPDWRCGRPPCRRQALHPLSIRHYKWRRMLGVRTLCARVIVSGLPATASYGRAKKSLCSRGAPPGFDSLRRCSVYVVGDSNNRTLFVGGRQTTAAKTLLETCATTAVYYGHTVARTVSGNGSGNRRAVMSVARLRVCRTTSDEVHAMLPSMVIDGYLCTTTDGRSDCQIGRP